MNKAPQEGSKEYQETYRNLESKKATIGIIGLGYVGLPLALTFIRESKVRVLGFDREKEKCHKLMKGESYLSHVPPKVIQAAVADRLLEATTNFDLLEECDAVVICVPTPLTVNKEPDVTFIEGACVELSTRLRRGQVVSLESTTYPETTEKLVRSILEEGSSLKAGEDFSLVYSPEREDPGNKTHTTYTIPKVVAGLTPRCLAIGRLLYSLAVATVYPVSNLRTAEITKLYENVYRSVNIALVNEMKMICQKMNIDIWEVVKAASTKPFGFQPFWPGPGVGGHCIPLDPGYLAWKAREYDAPTRFIDLASEINCLMPQYVVGRVTTALNRQGKSLKGSRVLVVGVAYKPDINDARESPALKVIELLHEAEADVAYHDPYVPSLKAHDWAWCFDSVPLDAGKLAGYDCALVLTHHAGVNYAMLANALPLVVDTRNVVPNMFGNVYSA